MLELGYNLGRFQSGKFAFMMFGLPMGALAIWLNLPKENRKQVMGIYFSAAFTSFLTGITEPIEYTFLFVAP
jgi:PTS system glucose-specific IIC component